MLQFLRAHAGNLLLLLSVMATSWILISVHNDEEDRKSLSKTGKIDYFAINLERVTLNEQGVLKDRLFTARLDHLVDKEETLLERPLMTFYDAKTPSSSPWRIYGDNGRLGNDGIVHLDETVLINRDALSKGERSIRIITSKVDIDPSKTLASTSEHIEMLSPPDEMSADGAEIQYTSPITIYLRSNVRRIHHVE